MRDGTSPEDQHATNDYLSIQDSVYNIVNQYEAEGRYEFFIMLAAEMMHNAINAGIEVGMDESEVLKEFAGELERHSQNQMAVVKADIWIRRFFK
jgi:hypothetical protein